MSYIGGGTVKCPRCGGEMQPAESGGMICKECGQWV